MKQAIAVIALLGLLLSGCTQGTPQDSLGTPPVVQTPLPTNGGTEEPPPLDPPADEPSAEEPDAPEPELPAEEPIRWYPRDIGHPLVTDDERGAGKKVALLTFDDGPTTTVTPLILDILKQEQIKALFFVTGYGAKNRDLVERIHREGHQIGTHTQNHEQLDGLTREQIIEAVEPVNRTVEEITGVRPRYFRPPHGAYDALVRDVLAELNLELINWSNGSLDWAGVDANGHKDPALVVQAVEDQLHPGAVILFHDTHKHTAEALPEIINMLRADGYEFVLLP